MDQLTVNNPTEPTAEKPPIINCHTHIFTGDHVPDLLGKTVLPWPFWKIKFRWIFARFRWWYYKGPYKKKHGGIANLKAQKKFEGIKARKKNIILNTLYIIIGTYLTLQSIHFFGHWLYPAPDETKGWILQQLRHLHTLVYKINIFFETKNVWLQLAVLLPVLLFYKSGRNLLLFIAKNTFSWMKRLPGKETKELLNRYMNIGRFAFHTEQGSTFSDLEGQYPKGSGFVVLPMDMEYMEAGPVAEPYKMQMEKLAAIKSRKKNIYPLVFVDPRRIEAEAETPKPYFDYTVNDDGKVELEDSFIKDYFENEDADKNFSGFKIYPALGYYPFDPLLLPLWKYAEQKGLPILTHCVRGPMYYRGTKKDEWDYHPIFEQIMGVNEIEEDADEEENESNVPEENTYYSALLLPQLKNNEFTANFTHPLNFICLLKKEFLAKAVDIAYNKASDAGKKNLKTIFGFTPSDNENKIPATIREGFGLDNLKICLGHYGGGDEWLRFFEKDRFKHSAQLIRRPNHGIDFIYRAGSTTVKSPGKPEQLWKYTDWYSIISSMMLQHENVYADISYILHSDAEILPLLKQTLKNPGLRDKVLYGTDFYVVRNHKSEKNMLADMQGGLSSCDFDRIARLNPRRFLNLPDTAATAALKKLCGNY